ncbi:MAG: hypothetical protein KQA41_04350 [Candidatus Aenigmarchaeota archaeon]|nr:hypothetical protein [Candidatus Aenigmarchaeota archaeon]MBU5689426.1 hypothetical protein [Candidatus Aenigmarchaeota archaeon]
MIAEMIIWFLLLQLFSFISLPLTNLIFHPLKDKGYPLSKTIGIFLFSFFTWYTSFIVKYDLSVIISFILFVGLNLYISKKKVIVFDKNIVKKTEILFLLSFIFFCLIRSLTPAVEGLEKLFDISIINGILQSEKMPPKDPWFAGYSINYYYFGHFTVATITKISHLESTTTFNLFLATIYSLLSVSIFSISYNITNSLKLGFFGIFIFLFLSNFLGFLQILTFLNPNLVEIFGNTFNIKYAMTCCHNPNQNFISFLFSFPVWSSTRVIPNTINEFPYANLMFGEVHSHIISLPIQLLFLSLILTIFLTKAKNKVYIFFSALLLAILYITNSWDFPTYFALFLTINFIILLEKKSTKKYFIVTILKVLILFILFSLPYINTVNKNSRIGFSEEKSNVFQELILFPIFIFSISYYYFKIERNIEKIFFVFLIAGIIYLITKIQIIIILFPLAFLSFKTMIIDKENRIIHVLSLFGILIMLTPEIFFIDSRYNTVFKFYYHIWIFWSIATIFIVSKLTQDKLFLFLLILLIILSLPMTIFSFIDRFNQGLNEGLSLDGLNYMKKYYPGDYALVKWAQKNIKNSEIILEASGDAFTYTSIYSSYTGLQTLVGWNNHVGIHHNIWPEERMNDIKIIYETNDKILAEELIKKYNISYIFFGSVEKKKYPNANITKFGDPIFVFEDNYIFKVK